jgi:uncharacterized protein YbjQ (UPF0145 family)
MIPSSRWRGLNYTATLRNTAKANETGIMLVTTTNDLPGYRVVETLGLVRGVIVRSRSSALGGVGASIQSFFGGTSPSTLNWPRTPGGHLRPDDRSCRGDGCRCGDRRTYDANEIADGITEVLAYGTAVRVESIR